MTQIAREGDQDDGAGRAERFVLRPVDDQVVDAKIVIHDRRGRVGVVTGPSRKPTD